MVAALVHALQPRSLLAACDGAGAQPVAVVLANYRHAHNIALGRACQTFFYCTPVFVAIAGAGAAGQLVALCILHACPADVVVLALEGLGAERAQSWRVC